MLLLATVNWLHYMFMVPLTLLSVFLMLVILVQRGRGGGLTGALGGMGGQSAFGTKAGDLFTRITIVVAALWVLLAMAALKVLNPHGVSGFNEELRGQATPSSKTTDSGLLPPTTKSPAAAATKSSEGETKTPASSETPRATAGSPSSAPATAENQSTTPSTSDAKPSDAAKP